MLIVSHNCFTL